MESDSEGVPLNDRVRVILSHELHNDWRDLRIGCEIACDEVRMRRSLSELPVSGAWILS